ncbi:hypothetical protein [Kitasatospora sp. SUK 42]|uniref:hypothetical protein n=1 Tax=Kitasatospora sp. SUK 42 TaxID=1588882 RepID=UPI0018CA8E22|nr:hypothetical protein [Kitasatospora sp. SUK 42]MBV2152168.1 hypothetical protein [Kitasatospora sp. SUK 42]
MNHLPADVARTLDVLLPEGHPLRAQLPYLRIESSCACGCTAYFTGADAVTGAEIVAEATIGCDGEVLLFAEGGRLSWLEVCSWTDPKLTLSDAARHLLQEPGDPD